MCDQKSGFATESEVLRIRMLMKRMEISEKDRPCVTPAIEKELETGAPATAFELPDGRIVTGKTSELLGATSAAMLNTLKALAGIDDDQLLISPRVIEPIQQLKVEVLGNKNPRLHTDEILIALSICASTNPDAERAMEQLENLRGCEVHSTVMLSQIDEKIFKRLGINLTCEPNFKKANENRRV
jgi:uncharacterized protein (UPF0371 family)